MRRLLFLGLTALCLGVLPLRGDERLEEAACRSVHLHFKADEGTAFYNEVTVDESAPGTYFCVCGWSKGYFGIQELGDGKKVVIFSVWDSDQDDPKAAAEDKRVKVLFQNDRVRVRRFGGEGSGGQSFLDYDWKTGAVYRFLTTAKVDGGRTAYTGYFRGPDEKDWTRLVTFSTLTGGKNLDGYYSFVEDFKRDGASRMKERKAHFGDVWVKTARGDWQAVSQALFTGDGNPALNIDAGADGDRFFLATGGATKNETTRLDQTISLPADAKRTPPEGLPQTG